MRKGWYTRCTKDSDTGPWGAPTTHTLRLRGAGGETGPRSQQGAPRAGTLHPGAQGSRAPAQGIPRWHAQQGLQGNASSPDTGGCPRGGLRAPSPGSPGPVDVLRAAHCQHQEPERKQLLGTPHGPSFRVERPSPRGGLEHRAQPCKTLCWSPLKPAPRERRSPRLVMPARLSRFAGASHHGEGAPTASARSPHPQPTWTRRLALTSHIQPTLGPQKGQDIGVWKWKLTPLPGERCTWALLGSVRFTWEGGGRGGTTPPSPGWAWGPPTAGQGLYPKPRSAHGASGAGLKPTPAGLALAAFRDLMCQAWEPGAVGARQAGGPPGLGPGPALGRGHSYAGA